MKGKTKVIAAVILVAVVSVIFLPRMFEGRDTSYAAAAPPAVEITKPVKGSIVLESTLIGTVEPSEVEYIYPEISGDVVSVKVKAGQKVSAGQVICTIENKQLDGARINVDTAQVNLNDAKAALERSKALYDSGDISSQSYEDAQNAFSRAKLSYESASNEYGNQSGYSTVTAKISGLVEACDVESHDSVTPQTQLAVISGGGEKVVSFEATERIIKQIAIGNNVVIEKGDTKYDGTISEVSTMVDEKSGLFKVKATLDASSDFATGTSVKLYVTSDKVENVTIIPVSAVYYEDGKALVYTYDKDVAHKVFIEEGICDEKNIEVISGLSNKDQVITTWSSELYEGAAVRLTGK